MQPTDPGVHSSTEDTLDLRLPDDFVELIACDRPEAAGGGLGQGAGQPMGGSGQGLGLGGHDLLDFLADWGPVATPVGGFQLVPVRLERDLPLLARWMNDPAVAAFWSLDGPESVIEAHLRAQLDGDGRSLPCLGVVGGVPMSYWEIYRADLDPLARHYPARPHDTGVHILIGKVADRARGIGSRLLRAVSDHILDHRPACARVVAEPDLRNTPCVAAFLSAGFRLTGELDLPGKRAALMIRDRALRALL
ncbi:RimJ/RimL family protein N-acetyltransferase [Streptomyces eurocidicus]|uniref:Lysine N-acyltransferase MbtK n=1 Tax=Streptomyces eurocidicus TaxID=66423 RepID=A0A7W8BF19_STREU|nr:GNAT family N-acetyltransferase [Streptomyces eurocidicus]MBB5122200.1 RimJ/RimL family protein N-acetyltransferase [Streptomyces eurocidicus]